MGEEPETFDPDELEGLMAKVRETKTLALGREQTVRFDPKPTSASCRNACRPFTPTP